MAELPNVEFNPEEPMQKVIKPEQPKSQMSELIEIFEGCKDYDEAMQMMKDNLYLVNGEEKFQGKYTVANARKCIRRLRDRRMFKGFGKRVPQSNLQGFVEAKDLTYKMEAPEPAIEPEPEQSQFDVFTEQPAQTPYTPQQPQAQQQIPPSMEQQLGFNPEQVTADPQVQKDVTRMLEVGSKSGFGGLAKLVNNEGLKLNNEETEAVGLCLKYAFPNDSGIMSPKTAMMLCLAGIFIPRIVMLVPESARAAVQEKLFGLIGLGGVKQ